MSVSDTAVGAILEIPAELLRDIQKAERYIENLQITSKRAAEAVANHWGNIAVGGLDSFIQKLSDAQNAMKGMGNGKPIEFNINTNQAQSNVEQLSSTTKKTTEDISDSVQNLGRLNFDFSKPKESLEQLIVTFKQLEAELKHLQSDRSNLAVGSTEAQGLNNVIAALKEYISLKKMSDAQLRTKITETDKPILEEQKRLLTEQLDLRKKINEQKKIVESGKVTGSEKLENEKKTLERIWEQYQKNKQAREELNRAGLSDAGQARFDISAEKQKNDLLAMQLKFQRDLNSELAKANEYTAQAQANKARISNTDEGRAQRQLNSDYKAMINILKEVGDIKAKAAEQGRSVNQNEVALIQALCQRYAVYKDDINRVSGAFANLAEARKKAFESDRSEQLTRNAIALADAQKKAEGNTKKLVAEYKKLYAENQKLVESMRQYFNHAGGNPMSAMSGTRGVDVAYREIEARHTEVLRQMRDLEAKNIQEIADFRVQKDLEANQKSISAFVQAEAQKTAEAKKQAEQQSNDRIQAYQKFFTTYQGAMAAANRLGTRGGQWEDTYENRARVIKNLEAAIKGLNKADSDYQTKLDYLTDALNRLKKAQKEVNDAMKEQKNVTFTDAQRSLQIANTTKTLRDYERAYKDLKDVISRTSTNDPYFAQLNSQIQQTKKHIDEIRKKMGELKDTTVKVSGVVGQLRNQIVAAFSVAAITGFVKKVTEVRAQFELQRVALGAIIQDNQRANQIFTEVQQMALQSPFSIMQLERATKQIAAFGFEVNKLKPTLKMLADMSAGLGVEIDRLILVMGHLKARGFLEGTMVRQFTNAGFNVLGGLAEYYSELEGKMVSVGEVQDRVKKKMVAFGDVEAVLKRVTSAGGMFYDMQKKQADSIWGMMQRITDAYDLMLNEIGQKNEGPIKAALTSVRFLISNWKTLANIMTGVTAAFSVYTAKLIYTAIATNTLSASNNVLLKSLVAVKNAIGKVWTFMAANPYLLLVAGAVAAGAALLDLRKKVDATHESYMNIIQALGDRQAKLNAIVDKISASNERIKTTRSAIDDTKEGTKEYNKAVAENKDALAEQYRVLQELRTAFPEVYNNIVKTKDGTVDLTKALEEFNRVSKMVAIITTMSDEDTHWYDEDFKEDMSDLSKSQEKYNAQLAKATAYFNSYVAKAEALYNTRKAEGSLSEEDEAKFKRIIALRDSELTIEQKIQEVLRTGYRFKDNWISDLKDNVVKLDNAFEPIKSTGKKKGYIFKDLSSDIAEAEKEVNAMVQRVLIASGVTSIEEFRKLPPETQKAAEEASQYMIRESGIALDEIQKDILHRNWEIPLQMEVVPKDVEPKLSYLQEKINEYIDKHPEINMPKIKADEGTDNYFKKLKNSRKDDIEDQKQYNAATAQLDKARTNAQVSSALQTSIDAKKAMMDYFGIIEKEKKGSKGSDTELKRWQDLKKAIEDVRTAYEKYRKSYNVEESNARIEKLFGPAFKELGHDISEFYKDGKYDAEALIDALEVLKGMTKATTEERKKFRSEIERKIGTTQVEIEVKMKEDAEKKLKADLDEMFANYELSEELKKIGVSVDLTYMVGGKPTTLQDIRAEIARLRAEGGDKADAENRIKILEDAEKKITQMELKAQKERLKNYEKYLAKAYSDSAKVQLEYYTKLTQMQEDFAKSEKDLKEQLQDPNVSADDKLKIQQALENLPNQASRAAKGMREEMEKELDKLNLDKLLKSPLFAEMFQDLGSMTNKVLDSMLVKIREIQNSANDLSLSQIRQLAQYAEKIENAKLDNSPFKEAYNAIKKAYELRAKGITAQGASDALAVSEAELERFETLKNDISLILGIKEKSYAIDGQNVNVGGQMIELTEQQISLLNKSTAELNEQSNALDNGIKKQKQVVTANAQNVQVFKNAKTATEKFGAALQEAAKVGIEAMNAITAGIQMFGGEVSESDQVWLDFVGNMLQTCITLGIAFVALGVEINSALGIIGIIATALSVVAGLFTAIFQAHDKRLEKQIERVQGRVDTLSKAFEKLEKSIEQAFNIGTEQRLMDQALDNLEAQRKGYEEMIRLEEDKKKTDDDKIKEYREKIAELAEAEKELYENMHEKYGSTNDVWSEANNWVDAWLDAYKEAGDGLDALNTSWNEFYENLVKKQATSKILSGAMEKYIAEINKAIEKNTDEYRNVDAFKEIGERFKNEFGSLNQQLIEFFKYAGIGSNGELILSDLQKGIQNITEPQAAAIEAYLNSMRFAVFRHTEQLDTLITTIQAQYGSGAENPVVTELKGIRGVLDNIYSTLRSVVKTQTGKTGIVIVG